MDDVGFQSSAGLGFVYLRVLANNNSIFVKAREMSLHREMEGFGIFCPMDIDFHYIYTNVYFNKYMHRHVYIIYSICIFVFIIIFIYSYVYIYVFNICIYFCIQTHPENNSKSLWILAGPRNMNLRLLPWVSGRVCHVVVSAWEVTWRRVWKQMATPIIKDGSCVLFRLYVYIL